MNDDDLKYLRRRAAMLIDASRDLLRRRNADNGAEFESLVLRYVALANSIHALTGDPPLKP